MGRCARVSVNSAREFFQMHLDDSEADDFKAGRVQRQLLLNQSEKLARIRRERESLCGVSERRNDPNPRINVLFDAVWNPLAQSVCMLGKACCQLVFQM